MVSLDSIGILWNKIKHAWISCLLGLTIESHSSKPHGKEHTISGKLIRMLSFNIIKVDGYFLVIFVRLCQQSFITKCVTCVFKHKSANLVNYKEVIFADCFSHLQSKCLWSSKINSSFFVVFALQYETVEFSVEDIPSPSVTYHLKMVELLEVRGGKNELEFMRFLLKHGRALDRMSISWAADVKDPKDITSEIMKFPRTSSNVVLKFLQLKSEVDVSRLWTWIYAPFKYPYVRFWEWIYETITMSSLFCLKSYLMMYSFSVVEFLLFASSSSTQCPASFPSCNCPKKITEYLII